jgi:hypothetical protein
MHSVSDPMIAMFMGGLLRAAGIVTAPWKHPSLRHVGFTPIYETVWTKVQGLWRILTPLRFAYAPPSMASNGSRERLFLRKCLIIHDSPVIVLSSNRRLRQRARPGGFKPHPSERSKTVE